MSFILEALRKAEQDRRGQRPPALRLADAERRPPRALKLWPITLILLLLSNTALLLWWQPWQVPAGATTTEAAVEPAPISTPISTATLSLDIHVYSEQPERSFVLINGRRYQQGDQITEGPLLQTITRDGALLVDRQQRRIELQVSR